MYIISLILHRYAIRVVAYRIFMQFMSSDTWYSRGRYRIPGTGSASFVYSECTRGGNRAAPARGYIDISYKGFVIFYGDVTLEKSVTFARNSHASFTWSLRGKNMYRVYLYHAEDWPIAKYPKIKSILLKFYFFFFYLRLTATRTTNILYFNRI